MEMISKEQVASYKRSDSYQRLRRLRNEGMKSLQGYYEKYKDKETYFKGETERKIVYERYSKGGMELPRGILTECHLEKLLIGNISHGRFIKNAQTLALCMVMMKRDASLYVSKINLPLLLPCSIVYCYSI